MLRREREILSLLLNSNKPLTRSQLAKNCHVSVRTIQKDIKGLNQRLEDEQVSIISIRKKGYFIPEADKERMRKQHTIQQVYDEDYIHQIPETPEQRMIFILLQLITHDQIQVSTFAEKMHVSVSTVEHDLQACKLWLKQYFPEDIKVSYSMKNGISLQADEIYRRKVVAKYISFKANASNIAKCHQYLFEDTRVDYFKQVHKLFHIVDMCLKKQGYYITGHSNQRLCFMIYIAWKRFKAGQEITKKDIKNHRLENRMRDVIILLKELIKQELNWNLPETEWLALQMYLITSQFNRATNVEHIITEDASHIYDFFVEKVKSMEDIEWQDEKIRQSLLIYLSPMLHRAKEHYCIFNPIRYHLAIDDLETKRVVQQLVDTIKAYMHLQLNQEEILYLSLCIYNVKKFWKKLQKIWIVTDYDESVIDFIKGNILNYVKSTYHLETIMTYQQFIFQEYTHLPDLIISTSTIADKTDLRVLYVNMESDEKVMAEYVQFLKNQHE